MKNKQVEERLFEAIKHTQKIMLDAKEAQVLPKVVEETKQKKHYFGWGLAGLAAIMVFALSFFLFQNLQQQNVDATIYLDVNPSVEIQVNQKDKVLDVIPVNEDGRIIIGDMNFKNSDLNVTVNALIGSMVRNGYLSELKNSVLISVDTNDKSRAEVLENKLTREIDGVLQESALQGAILSQAIDDAAAIQEKANTYHISNGKAKLIEEITNNTYHEFEDLVDLSINDLNLIAKNKTNIHSQGEASQTGYIGEEAALTSAINYFNVNRNEVTMKEMDFDYENGVMVYEVEFYVGNNKYEADVNASTGAIVKTDVEMNDRKQNNNQAPVVAPTIQPTPTQKPRPSNNQTQTNVTITMDGAIDIALNHAGLARNNIYDLDAELERNVYEVSFKAGGYEYDYDIDATTGEIRYHKVEYDD